jgi:ArsR family transcriptional regulator
LKDWNLPPVVILAGSEVEAEPTLGGTVNGVNEQSPNLPRASRILANEANLGLASTSQHLKALRAAGLVEAEKTYRLADEQVCQFFRSLRSLAETRLAEIREITREFLADRQGLEPVDREALLTKVREGAVTVPDVRPVEECRTGHIPGALCIPLKELERRRSDLPREREIVA